MLSKDRKITRALFKRLNGRGLTYHSPHLFLSIYKNEKQEKSRFTIIISKKVAKNAVSRNKIRRRFYSIITKNLLNIENGYMCIINCKKQSNSLNYKEIEEQILILLTKAGLLIK